MSLENEPHNSETMFEDIVAKARELVIDGEYYVPIVVFEANHRIFLHHVDPLPEKWSHFMRELGKSTTRLGKLDHLEQVFMIFDGWLSIEDPNKPIKKFRLSSNPDCKEILIVSGLQVEQNKKCLKLFEMVRNENQRVVDLPEISLPEEVDAMMEVPFLAAFVQGFRLAFSKRKN